MLNRSPDSAAAGNYYPGQFGPTAATDPNSSPPVRLRPLPDVFSLGDPVVADLPPARLMYTLVDFSFSFVLRTKKLFSFFNFRNLWFFIILK